MKDSEGCIARMPATQQAGDSRLTPAPIGPRASMKKQKLATLLSAEIKSKKQHEDYENGMAVLNPLSVSVAVTPTPKKRRKVQTEGGPRRCGACGEGWASTRQYEVPDEHQEVKG
jgi:hypothetical protein